MNEQGSAIRQIDAWAVRSDLPDMEIGGGITKRILMRSVVVRITTEDGLEGWGDSWMHEVDGPVLLEGVKSALGPLIVGERAEDITALWDKLFKVARNSSLYPALSAIDIALWDLKGKRHGAPIYQLLGGAAHDYVDTYATIAWRLPKERLAELVAAAGERGFDGAKVAVGHGRREDRALIERIRTEAPDVMLAVDANGGYDVTDALAVGRICDEFDVRWFEEPVAYPRVADLALLNARLETPVSGFQYDQSIYTMRRHLEVDALSIYQPSLYNCGGLTQAWKMSVLADAWGRRFAPHSYAPALAFAASVHVAAVAPTGGLTEFPVLEPDPRDIGRYAFADHLADGSWLAVDESAHIPLPTSPGLGVEGSLDRIRELEIR